MLGTLIKRVFGSRNERIIRRMKKNVEAINLLEPSYKALSDKELAEKTQVFKTRLNMGESLENVLIEAFATVREVSRRTLGLRHFDVQLIGGMVLHEGNIAEMRTGEGKTLVATLPAYLNALTGKGVHIITVNDYLARRDSEWMKPIYEFLGLTVGVITTNQPFEEKFSAYRADIVYGTNNEYGFDYLRDNMAFGIANKVQRELNFAIVDEVDSILIDEARTPLIISGAAEDSSDLYIKVNRVVPLLKLQRDDAPENAGDYTLDEKQKQVHLTEQGQEHIEEILLREKLLKQGEGLYHPSNINLVHHVNASLRAHALYHKDVDYIIQNQQVVIVDEHTGRTMPGRRWSEGLHQAIEAKEHVPIANENQTLASITFQNFFRLYQKLAGMTGTADTEAYEFQQIYNLEVVVIPTNKPMCRADQADLIYLGQQDKYQAIIEDIRNCMAKNQPVLVGTASIEASEYLSELLKKERIPHQVLNAKFHEKEAHIIAEAGRPGTVTIATNMAGRGTDIVLGGSLSADLSALPDDATESEKQKVKEAWQQRHNQVIAAGGLRIIGSERHESRRIDNQLRGRSGRQGDAGSSRFYLSLEDHLMRIFASERTAMIMKRLGMKPGEPIEHPLVTRAIENAQRKLEGYHFDVRKQLLEYDNVANEQRKVIYSQRDRMMAIDDVHDIVLGMLDEVIEAVTHLYVPLESFEEQWDVTGLMNVLADDFQLKLHINDWIEKDNQLQPETIASRVKAAAREHFEERIKILEVNSLAQVEKSVILQMIDQHWRDHLASMDNLRQGIHLRGYAQKDPKQEYKREAFALFSQMLESMKYAIIQMLMTLHIDTEADIQALEEQREAAQIENLEYHHANDLELNRQTNQKESVTIKRGEKKVGRNDACPCGSGKKFKVCHGRLA